MPRRGRLCAPTMQDLWNSIFKATAKLGALISILDPLRARLHARKKAIALLHLIRQRDSKNAEGQVQPAMA